MVFVHSAKVPQNYKNVAKVIKKVQEEGLGLKECIYGSSNKVDKNNQRNLALASKILEKSKIIDHILRTTQILIKEPSLDPWLARVLIHESVWRKDLNHECKPIQTVIKYKQEIKDAFEAFDGVLEPKRTKKVIKPRYIRINTFKKSTAEVIESLRNDGLTLVSSFQVTYSEYLEAISNLSYYEFLVDFHIKDMLVFAPSFQFFKHNFYNDGIFILQDKSSCLAPLLLDPPPGGVVLDMCAAPGMKTNYLANLVGKNGRVYAVEQNQQRYLTLSRMITQHGMKNVHCMHRDATGITGDELADVEYILVDPSCSGSGIVDRIDFEKSKPNRLQSLSKFQIAILRCALKNFPNVKRVAYSTCSINAEENEEVVSEILKQVQHFQLINLQEKLQGNWNHFGSEKYENVGSSCLYANPEKDKTNGFFVAVFERIASKKKKRKHEENEEHKEEEAGPEETKQPGKKKNKQTRYTEQTVEETEVNDETTVHEKKKKKKRKHEENEEPVEYVETEPEETKQPSKKKNKQTKQTEQTVEETEVSDENTVKDKKKKKKKLTTAENKDENALLPTIYDENLEQPAVKQKKKKKMEANKQNEDTVEPTTDKDKKKNRSKMETEENCDSVVPNTHKEKKKKKNKNKMEASEETCDTSELLAPTTDKKKKDKNKTETIQESEGTVVPTTENERKKKKSKKEHKLEFEELFL